MELLIENINGNIGEKNCKNIDGKRNINEGGGRLVHNIAGYKFYQNIDGTIMALWN